MDPQLMMTMFREMMREERKEIMEMFFKHLAGSGQNSTTREMTSVPNLMSALSNRIDKWYTRYKKVFVEDAKQLTESVRSQREAEIRQRLIAVLDREYKAGPKMSLQELYREWENFLSLKKNSETIASNVKTVEAAVK
ncbi:hypothetical protein ANCDUO_02904 [Ancylostoma duodenale]|uniref:Uncharacterized protein n=1 Tax=Ancylostoma duodenale TaxID=51022 RepID=A0A0C2GZ40_9BILA|nr:hypothetical protein ANCDUO_02904 [Ancylostoma duodenale]